MSAWDEIKLLSTQLKDLQNKKNYKKTLNERVIVEILQQLKEKNILDFYKSKDGKYVYTLNEICKRIKNELKFNGIMTLENLSDILNISLKTLDGGIRLLLEKNSIDYKLVIRELFTIDHTIKILEKLKKIIQSRGTISIVEVCRNLQISRNYCDYIISNYVYKMSYIYLDEVKSTLYSNQYMLELEASVYGAIFLIVKPIDISDISDRLDIPISKVNSLLIKLIKNGKIFGTVYNGKWITNSYIQNEITEYTTDYNSFSFLNLSNCKFDKTSVLKKLFGTNYKKNKTIIIKNDAIISKKIVNEFVDTVLKTDEKVLLLEGLYPPMISNMCHQIFNDQLKNELKNQKSNNTMLDELEMIFYSKHFYNYLDSILSEFEVHLKRKQTNVDNFTLMTKPIKSKKQNLSKKEISIDKSKFQFFFRENKFFKFQDSNTRNVVFEKCFSYLRDDLNKLLAQFIVIKLETEKKDSISTLQAQLLVHWNNLLFYYNNLKKLFQDAPFSQHFNLQENLLNLLSKTFSSKLINLIVMKFLQMKIPGSVKPIPSVDMTMDVRKILIQKLVNLDIYQNLFDLNCLVDTFTVSDFITQFSDFCWEKREMHIKLPSLNKIIFDGQFEEQIKINLNDDIKYSSELTHLLHLCTIIAVYMQTSIFIFIPGNKCREIIQILAQFQNDENKNVSPEQYSTLVESLDLILNIAKNNISVEDREKKTKIICEKLKTLFGNLLK
ncbi:hypothetical protein A3Q56_05615 [Intoshia linei]|uniref:E3 UFM1-protein ligase 1-like N-terminal domain-containing protein n=1 Tax=Intoshia linei TaxID=1819745 RepID=A0A177AXD1_9BILA|nr:hypothetical protein A3Q56_05615 [Intoshia linei]